MFLPNATHIFSLVLLAQAAPLSVTLSVSELLANTERYNGQPVTVSGTINNFRANPSGEPDVYV
jgi:hypothetical protein